MKPAVGVDGQGETKMTARTIAISRTNTDLLAIALAAMIGVGLIFVAGFSSAAALHDTGHDQRHSIAFPCH
jgi:cobalt transporter subunit CbtB